MQRKGKCPVAVPLFILVQRVIWRRFEVRGRGRFELGFVAFQMQTWESADNASMMQWQKQRYEAYRRYGGQISEGSPTVAITVL